VHPGQPLADYQRQVYGVLADLALRNGQFSEALQLATDGQRRFAGDDYLAYLQAEALYELDHYDAALQILVRLMDGPPSWQFRAGTPTHIRRKLAPRRLADILRLQGNLPAAEAVLLKILEEFPADTMSWLTLGQAYVSARQHEQLEYVLGRLRTCPQGEIFADVLLATWHLVQNQLDQAELALERLIAAAPQMPMPRLMRAELLRRQGAPREAILQACRDILRVQPGNAEAARVMVALERQPQPTRDRGPSEYFTSVVLDPGIPGGVVLAG
jgi:predicted Zn-dependent protease